MNIIIDPENLQDYQQKFTVLELDTIRVDGLSRTVTAYCVIEQIPIMELPHVESKRNLHQNLIDNYRKKDWNFCIQALDHLMGSWNGEVDSFYEELRGRVTKYIEQDPGEDWDGIISKNASD